MNDKLGLPGEYFNSEAIFAAETQKIFQTHWLCATRTRRLCPGSYAVQNVEGQSILLTRDQQDNHLRAFHNVCRHRGAILCDAPGGKIQNGCLTCPYHAWAYGADGRLRRAPNLASENDWNQSELGLVEVACVEWNGYAMIHLGESADFDHDFGSVRNKFDPWRMGELHVASQLEYEIAANWKVIFQNYSECYHCPTVHPALNRLSPFKSASNDLLAGAFLGGPMQLADGIETMSKNGKSVATTIEGLNPSQQRQVGYYTLFPTMFISPHPDYVMVHRLHRLNAGTTRIICEFLVQDENPDNQKLAAAVDFWDETNRQDWHVCERVQSGSHSPGFKPATYSSLETVLPEFDRYYRTTMSVNSQ